MKHKMFIIICLLVTTVISQACASKRIEANRIKVQIALLLDTSSSMNGLIEQAKAQLWNIANDITNYNKNDEQTFFEIALYEYGKSELPSYTGHIKQLVSFTTDMDHLSEVLFALKTNGGNEYCGLVIHKSLKELKWNEESDMKMIYIAGNESFKQGNLPYQQACKEAKNKGIIINTIYCGNQTEGINLAWKTGAILAQGDYHTIDHNNVTVHIKSPYDSELVRLNELLNKTYIYYGKQGYAMKENMTRQDLNSKSYGMANYAKRSIFKSKSQFDNQHWDLVDAYEKDKTIIQSADNLPSTYKSTSTTALEKIVLKKLEERKSIEADIACLAVERKKYIEEIKKKEKEIDLGSSITNSLKKQMIEKGFVRIK